MTAARSAPSRPRSAAPVAARNLPGPGTDPCTMRMAPRREPPFDDELPTRHLSLVRPVSAPELPFPAAASTTVSPPTLTPPTLTPQSVRPRRRLTLVPDSQTDAPTSRNGVLDHPAGLDRPPEHRPRPDPSRFGRQFAQGVVEVLSGRRPMVQLTRHVSPAVQRGLTRAGTGHQLRSAVAPVIHSVHLSEPAVGVCEMSAIVVVGVRYRAIAARLEWRSDQWRCTALQIG